MHILLLLCSKTKRFFPCRPPLRSLLAFSLAFLLYACSSTPEPVGYQVLDSSSAEQSLPEASTALQQANRLSGKDRQLALLDHARQYLSQGDTASAALMLKSLQAERLDDAMRTAYIILSAQVALSQQDPDEAMALLTSARLEASRLEGLAPLEVQTRMQLLRADALAMQGKLVQSIRERVAAAPMLSGEQEQYNHKMIWLLANHISLIELEQTTQRTAAQESLSDLNGWLQLAFLYRDPLADIDTQAENLDRWLDNWSRHPAAKDLPPVLKAMRTAAKRRPENIAVLLPMSGPYAASAKAIQDGILTAYFSAVSNQRNTPSVRFYDTMERSIPQVYDQALREGAEFVIGPLGKAEVKQLSTAERLPVSTLALNYIESETLPEKLFQFGLAAEDEAEQIAIQARQEGSLLAGILYPDNNWGQRVANAFINTWRQQGGIVTALEPVKPAQDPGQHIKKLLQIGNSEGRFQRVRRYVKDKVQFEPRRRQDIDFLFVVTNPEQARRIKPALNFHFAGSIPVFSTSHINDGLENPNRDKDLNRIRFVDTPWMLQKDSNLHQLVKQSWPDGHGRYERLFALGMDAYRLHARLEMLKLVPESSLPGATGQLAVQKNGHLQRKLEWAWFRSGKAVRTPVVAGIKEQRNVILEQQEPEQQTESQANHNQEAGPAL